jgi:hypothetical protein
LDFCLRTTRNRGWRTVQTVLYGDPAAVEWLVDNNYRPGGAVGSSEPRQQRGMTTNSNVGNALDEAWYLTHLNVSKPLTRAALLHNHTSMRIGRFPME